jgi:hypothetical protein
MGDTFKGTWNRPKTPDRGRSKRELEDFASFDNEPQVGCGAVLLLCILAIATAIGLAVS